MGFRMELVQGATPICEGSCHLTPLRGMSCWNDYKSCKVRVGSNGNSLWEASVLLGRKKEQGFGSILSRREREISCTLRHLKVLMKDCMTNVSRWMKLFNEYGFEAKYHLGKANVVVESWSRKKSEAKNKFWIDVAWLGPTSVKRDGEWFILVRQGSDLQLERLLMPRVVKSRDEIFSRWGYCDNHDLSRLDKQFIERDRLIGIGIVLNFIKFISFTFSDKEMIIEI
ncbi:hypothetical protein Tco_1065507 [Tanacetum coccineum]